MNRVVRVYGTCDDWQVEFRRIDEHKWQCQVPADMTDGQYACQFYAVDEEGDIGFWCGMLYMSSGKVCIAIDEDPFEFFFVKEKISFEINADDGICFMREEENIGFSLQEETLSFEILRRCCDGLCM